jgi:hypothetical protein
LGPVQQKIKLSMNFLFQLISTFSCILGLENIPAVCNCTSIYGQTENTFANMLQ